MIDHVPRAIGVEHARYAPDLVWLALRYPGNTIDRSDSAIPVLLGVKAKSRRMLPDDRETLGPLQKVRGEVFLRPPPDVLAQRIAVGRTRAGDPHCEEPRILELLRTRQLAGGDGLRELVLVHPEPSQGDSHARMKRHLQRASLCGRIG